ncbi:hypothetical protein A2U01_0019400, partial [Trifolium medium]|nr:hypothetical protein [Trifolium medium]
KALEEELNNHVETVTSPQVNTTTLPVVEITHVAEDNHSSSDFALVDQNQLKNIADKDLNSNLHTTPTQIIIPASPLAETTPVAVDTLSSSEFVDNTPPIAEIEQLPKPPDVVKKDIQFLNESCANLAELEDDSDVNVANIGVSSVSIAAKSVSQVDLNQHADSFIESIDDGQFQTVVSKASKKAMKAKPTIHRSSNTYPTRSKAVLTKPSK